MPIRISNHLQTILLLGMSLIFTYTGTVFAAATDEEFDNIFVTGTRTTEILAEVPNATTVIRLDEIEARNETSVTDLLRNLAGIHVIQPSGQGGVARVFIRGGDLELTMVLLDGVRVNDPNDSRGSAFDFSTVSLTDVERIEIVRGPQSAVYGSDALAGVINIISKSPMEVRHASIFAEAGTGDYYRGAVDVSGPLGNAGGFSLRMTTKDDGEPVTDTTFSSDSFTGRLSLERGESWDMQFLGSYSSSNGTAFPEDSGGAELAVLRAVDTRSADDLRLAIDGSFGVTKSWRLNALASWYDHDADFVSPGVAPGIREPVPPNGADSNLKRIDAAVNAVLEFGDKSALTFGVDYYDEDGLSDGFVEFAPGFKIPAGFEFDRSVMGAFTELLYKSAWGPTILASIRHDDPNEESGETTARFGVLFDFNRGQTTIHGNWGQGFSLPGFFALASPLVGNPGLRPETSDSLDVGITQRSADKRIAATLTVFHNEFTDLIDFDTTIFSMVNRNRLKVDGVEMQLDYSINEILSLRAQASSLDMEVENSTTPLRHRPDWRGSLAIRWSPSDTWLVDASWLSVGETFDSSIPTGDMFLDAYNRVDVTVNFRPMKDLHLLLSVDNLFDKDYAEAIGFPSPGARIRLGIRYQF